jgi:GT2 family glycosyltransferase
MQLSVVILNYNVRYFLEQCLLTVQEAVVGLEAEIIVVDNASADDSCAMVRERFPNVILLENKENVGFSKANNQGVAIAKGEYVCILNPDTALQKNTFKEVLSFAENHPDFGAIGIRYIDGTGNFLPECKRNIPSPKVSLHKILGLKSEKYAYYATHLLEEESGEVAVLAGAFMLIKKERYQEVGGFDEDYFMYGEDIDLSYKLTKAGYTNYYFGKIPMLHYKGESTTKDKIYLRRFYGAMRIFYRKHFRHTMFLKLLVYLGVHFSRIIALFRLAKAQQRQMQKESHFVLSKNTGFVDAYTNMTSKTTTITTESVLSSKNISDCQIVFDAEVISYDSIFSLMERHKNQGNTFRIKPQKAEFILGSDGSDSKGEVLALSTN